MNELSCLPYGVGHRDEGICLEMRLGHYRVLLDCGLAVSDVKDIDPAAGAVDFVLCSHAHSDHGRGLWAFHQRFPKVPIYASEATAKLLPLNWLNEPEAQSVSFCQGLPWRSPIPLAENLTAELWPAGHLPGATCFVLSYAAPERTYRVVYTGDFFLSNARLVDGLPLNDLRGLHPDVLLLEGSYGIRRYPHRRQQENQLAERINRAIADQKNVILPTPALGLGQELLMFLRSHHQFTGRKIDIWVDKTVAAGCDAYLDLLPHLPNSVQNFAQHQPLFWDERVFPRVRRLPPEGLAAVRFPAIVIAHRTPDLGQQLAEAAHPWMAFFPSEVQLPPATQPVYESQPDELKNRATSSDPPSREPAALASTMWQRLSQALTAQSIGVEPYMLTLHCDGVGTTQLIHNLRPQHVVLVHGSPAHLADLAGLEELQSRYQLHLPSPGHLVELPIGETFIQPEAPNQSYEGELSETPSGIYLMLPPALAQSESWKTLAETGVIEAQWQGNELIIRGISQDELMNLADSAPPEG